MSGKWKIGLLVGLVVAALGGAVLYGVLAGTVPSSESQPGPKPSASVSATVDCASTGITASKPFYADLARVGSNQFGPDQNYHDKATALKKLATTMSCDYYIAAVEVDFRASGNKLSVDQVNATAKTYGGSKTTWSNAVYGFLGDIDVAKTYTKYEDKHYATLGAIPNGTKEPTLFSATPDHAAEWVLVLTFKDGTVREIRIVCLLQPVEISFPNVPKCTPTAQNHNCGSTPPPRTPGCTGTKTNCGGGGGCGNKPCTKTSSPPGCTTCGGKHQSEAPPNSKPIAQCGSGKHPDRKTGKCVPNTTSGGGGSGGSGSGGSGSGGGSNTNPGQGDSGLGGTNTTTAPKPPTTGPGAPTSAAPTTPPPGPPQG